MVESLFAGFRRSENFPFSRCAVAMPMQMENERTVNDTCIHCAHCAFVVPELSEQ